LLATGVLTSKVKWASAGVAESFESQLDVAPPRQVVKWREETFVVPAGATGSVDATDESQHRLMRILISNDGSNSSKTECQIAIESEDEEVVLRPIPIADGL